LAGELPKPGKILDFAIAKYSESKVRSALLAPSGDHLGRAELAGQGAIVNAAASG